MVLLCSVESLCLYFCRQSQSCEWQCLLGREDAVWLWFLLPFTRFLGRHLGRQAAVPLWDDTTCSKLQSVPSRVGDGAPAASLGRSPTRLSTTFCCRAFQAFALAAKCAQTPPPRFLTHLSTTTARYQNKRVRQSSATGCGLHPRLPRPAPRP